MRPLAARNGLPPLPTFIIIGAQKSATRWLRLNLGRLPDVFSSPHEVKFFNHPKRVRALGADWYRAQFAGWDGEPVVGEATPGYMMFGHGPAEVAGRIDAMVPDVRLIALLRDPTERALSAFLHHQRGQRIHPRAQLLPTVRRTTPEDDWLGLVSGGWYAASLAPFFERFGDRLLVLLHDDLVADAGSVFDDAVRHVGAQRGSVPPDLQRVRFSNRRGDEPGLPSDEREELFAYFADDVDRLERMIGRDLSAWRPSATPG